MRRHHLVRGVWLWAGLLLACPAPRDTNEVEEFDWEEFQLDMASPMAQFTIDACSTAPRLEVTVAADVHLPAEAIVGITLEHGGRIANGFVDTMSPDRTVSATMLDVGCDNPIDVTVERLDGLLLDVAIVRTMISADAQGREGTTDLEASL